MSAEVPPGIEVTTGNGEKSGIHSWFETRYATIAS
jgi:hypothetical protein